MLQERLTRRSLLVATSAAILHQVIGNKANAMFMRVESSPSVATVPPITLMYHDLNYSHKGKKIEEENWVSPEKFKEQIEDAVRSGRKITTASEALENPDSSVAPTLDDDIHVDYDIVLPYFLPRGMKGTFFISVDLLRGGYYMTPQHVREISDCGFEIGSHGKRHVSETNLSPEELNSELVYSKNYLEDLIGKEVPLFAYPNGEHNERVAEAVYNAGYRGAFFSPKKYTTRTQTSP